MQIVADENIPGLDDTFGEYGSIIRLNGRSICSKDLAMADVLLVRSVTQVNRDLLYSSPVRFVGSATIGFDHLDARYLEESGITWCHAPGCNADAAAQYTLAMLLLAADRGGLDVQEATIGIVGLGNVGSRLHRLLSAVGIKRILACDPPLADMGQAGLVSMERITECNLVSFHVPLTRTGAYPTWQMGNADFLHQLPAGALVINNSRGQVLDGRSLLGWLEQGKGHAALDVWPNEPDIDLALLKHVLVATPHVAGYTLEGKLNGTRKIYEQFLDWQGIKAKRPLAPYPPPPLSLPDTAANNWQETVIAACRPGEDDLNMRAAFKPAGQSSATVFDRLRKNYPERRDFSGCLIPENYPVELSNTLKSLGFNH
jgi:erythronate-4-phosphate dehydrogenase